jgi:hypothetical protein
MGIKFHCPNGHRLNVKSFLAGKKGVCPKCGAKMRIPTASEPALVHSELVHSELDSELDEEEGDAAQHPAKSNGAGAGVIAAPAVSAATAAQQGTAATAADDPIAEAPAAIWYVRPPSGGQYGPARGEIMRRWIAEGRVSSDSLVWREGWTDWQNAGKLFPVLQAAGTAAAAPATATVSTTVPISARSSIRSATRYQEKKRETSSLAVGILVSLGVVCLVLVGVLVYVLSHLK